MPEGGAKTKPKIKNQPPRVPRESATSRNAQCVHSSGGCSRVDSLQRSVIIVFFLYDYPLLLAAVLLVLSSIYRPLVAYVSCEHMYVSLKPTLGVGGLGPVEAARCFHFLNRTPSPRGSFGLV